MKKRGRLLRILTILGVVGAVSVAVFLYFGGQGSSVSLPFLGEPPVVIITQPTSTVSVFSGNGVAIRAVATSANGIARIEFLVNGETKESVAADDPTQTSFPTSFLWFSSQVGQQTLSVVAFDPGGRASQLASIHVNVFALEAAQVDGVISNDPAQLAGGEAAPAGDANQDGAAGDGVLGGDPGAEPADQGGALGQPEQPVADQAAPQPLADNPPTITFFDYDLDLIADGARINWFISAEDDLGLDKIHFISFRDGAVVFDLEFDCGGAQSLLCEYNLPGAILPGESLFSVQAIDVSGQTSEAELLFAELVGEPGQPPAAAEHDGGFALPVRDLVVDLNWPFGDLGFGVDDFFGQFAPDVEGDPGAEPADQADEAEPVAEGNLAEIELILTTDVVEIGGVILPERVLVEAQFPADFPWPAGDGVFLLIEDRWGESEWSNLQDEWARAIQIGDGIRGEPFVLEQLKDLVCGSEDWSFRLVFNVDGEDVEFGQIASITTPPCEPVSPISFSVNAASGNGCPGNIPYCVIVTWALDETPPPLEEASAGAFLILKRIDRFGFETIVRIPINETQYIDLQPTWISEGRWCVPPDRYSIRVYDNQGRHASSLPGLVVDLPNLNCVDPWNFHGEDSRQD